MPIGFDPDETASFHLAHHAHLPADKRPTWHVPFMTAKQSRKSLVQAKEMFAKFDQEQDADKQIDLLIEAAKVYIVRVDNVGGISLDDALNDLTVYSLDKLTDQMLSVARLSESERGKSGPAAPGATETPAPGVAPPAAA